MTTSHLSPPGVRRSEVHATAPSAGSALPLPPEVAALPHLRFALAPGKSVGFASDAPLDSEQIKVRDLSHTSVSIAPADYANWHDVRTELMAEAKTGFKARVEAELAAAGGENLDELKAAFQQARTTQPTPSLRSKPTIFPYFIHSMSDS